MKTQVYVTEADIEYGKRFSRTENPINLAIKRTYWLWKVEVFPDRLVCTRLGERKRTFKLPPDSKITKFLFKFHSGEKVKPFRETINLPG